MVCKALDAADLLAGDGIQSSVTNVATIKPLDEAAVYQAAKDVALLVSVEEHSIIGGLGSALAECLADATSSPPLLCLGVRDQFGESGLADELLELHRLTGRLIADDIRAALL
jgi:transketolase